MKVVLFCGGLGLRLREHDESLPKPMVSVGYRPILWHVMKYYAHHGHKDFVLCLGYKADVIKRYFLNYEEAQSNDFVLSDGGRSLELLSSDIDDWRITFVDTGMHANIGQRLVAIRRYVQDEELFLASYSDCVTDAPLPRLIEDFEHRGKVGSFLSVRPAVPGHFISQRQDGVVTSIIDPRTSGLWVNGGYFILRPEIFDHIEDGDELVLKPFQRLIAKRQLITYPYDGFWAPMDTLRDRQELESLFERGRAPWAVWEDHGTALPVIDHETSMPLPALARRR
jgi:glucose-1-phosphate cytidylyltransferase